jgi:hypothetical protein
MFEEMTQSWAKQFGTFPEQFQKMSDPSTFFNFVKASPKSTVQQTMFENYIKYHKAYIDYQKSMLEMTEAMYESLNLIKK